MSIPPPPPVDEIPHTTKPEGQIYIPKSLFEDENSSNKQFKLYIGLMSGTSLDGVDGAIILVDDQDNILFPNYPRTAYLPYDKEISNQILKLCSQQNDEMITNNFLQIEKKITELNNKVVQILLKNAGLSPR